MRGFITGSLLLSVSVVAGAQQLTGAAKWADSARTIIDDAALGNPRASLDSAVVLLDRALAASPNDYLLLHYKGYALYRAGNTSVRNEKKDAAKGQFQEADSLLALSIAQRPLPESFALRASLAGHLASLDPTRAQTYGMAAGQMQARAAELGPNNPRVALLRGTGALYGPAEYTGGVKEAVKHLERAHDLFAKDAPARPLPSWGRAEACANLAMALHQTGDDARALTVAREALTYVPDYGYVKYKILPMLGAKP